MTQYFGKYRGTVVNNVDPLRQGRLQVGCPLVFGVGVLAWAMPCVPFAGMGEGFYMLPQIGTQLWVEFERGEANLPIWSGCFWGPGQLPTNAISPTTRTIKTLTTELTLDDALGVTVQVMPPTVPAPCVIRINATGIEISMGAASVKLDPAKVDINNGALEVT
ncbi:MAG: phage baseplate assembly protein V [Nannocystaceae bacterium]